MKIAIIRRAPQASFSMDVYGEGLVRGLKQVRPHWSIIELTPSFREYKGSFIDRVGKYYSRYWALPRQVARKTDFDIFHIIDHSDGHFVYHLGKMGQPVIVTCHDLINFLQPENISDQSKLPIVSTLIWKYAVRGICRADHIVTVSDHTAKEVMTTFSIEPERLTTAHNGVDPIFHPLPPDQRKTLREKFALPSTAFCLLNVGSNQPRKNIFTVLRAIDLLNRQNTDIHFVKAGSDFNEDQKNFIHSQNLTGRVTYIEKPDKEQLVQLYNAGDILVAPSLYEGFGITPLEAMACGTPAITSNVTSFPEVMSDAGMMVDPLDFQGLASAILWLKQNSAEYQSLASKGVERARSFTWERHAEQVAKVYERKISQSKKLCIS